MKSHINAGDTKRLHCEKGLLVNCNKQLVLLAGYFCGFSVTSLTTYHVSPGVAKKGCGKVLQQLGDSSEEGGGAGATAGDNKLPG